MISRRNRGLSLARPCCVSLADVTKPRFTPQYARIQERLRALRERKGIDQSELAKRMGVPQQYISRYEIGETRMDVVQLWLYCRALGASFTALCRQLEKDFADEGVRRPPRP